MRSRSSRFLALVTALASCAAPEPAPAPGEAASPALRIVSWNVHDLFDEIDRTAPPGNEDTVATPAAVEAKLARVGAVLDRLDGDVLVLQEVEGAALLERLAAGALRGRGYRAWLREGRDPRGIDVGVLARVPFEVGPTHLDERGQDGGWLWSRDVVELRLAVGSRPLTVLGAHLVSRRESWQDGRRLEQAARLRVLAEDAARGTGQPAVLVLGDLNDLPSSAPLAGLLSGGWLADLGARLGAAEGWTWAGGGARERIDYGLLSAADVALVTRVGVEGGVDVAAASDHRPLVIDLWAGAAPWRPIAAAPAPGHL